MKNLVHWIPSTSASCLKWLFYAQIRPRYKGHCILNKYLYKGTVMKIVLSEIHLRERDSLSLLSSSALRTCMPVCMYVCRSTYIRFSSQYTELFSFKVHCQHLERLFGGEGLKKGNQLRHGLCVCVCVCVCDEKMVWGYEFAIYEVYAYKNELHARSNTRHTIIILLTTGDIPSGV